MPASEVEKEPCPRCGGRGWVVSADGGAGTARPCSCRAAQVVPRLLAAAGVPERYGHCKIANFRVADDSASARDQLIRARDTARLYVDDFLQPEGGFRESGLLFIGPPGIGKTHLAVAILIELIEQKRVRGRFVEFTSLVHQIQSTFDPGSPESKREILDPLTGAELLVLDELGSQQPTPWVRDVLYLIVNQRYTRRLPTIFTTNYRLQPPPVKAAASLDRGRDAEPPMDEAKLLAPRISAMLVSRLYEMAQPVDMSAVGDHRFFYKSHKARTL